MLRPGVFFGLKVVARPGGATGGVEPWRPLPGEEVEELDESGYFWTKRRGRGEGLIATVRSERRLP